ncbi:MAG TPA: HDOD domain-containing protein [Bryobacteraceae bacterium]|jgi:HD-like signal output (HDOD) protein|nr:HDOD domain-containing protein [Bryobacteraceae bacterium]
MSDADDKYRAVRRLPAFPAIATKLLRVLSHEDANIKEIVDLIRADAALVSELLRIVNSPVYGFSGRISSLQNAVTLLGLQTVKSFALTVAMKGFLNTALRLDLLRRLWRHSLACGLLCEELSVVCSTSGGRDDRAYTAGLLHNIGSLGLFVAHPRTYAELLSASTGSNLLDRERETFGIDHTEAGGWLAQSWGLPEDIQQTVITHHQPPSENGAFDLNDLVRIGVLLAESLGFDVVTPAKNYVVADVRSFLPQTAQYRFDPDPSVMLARVTERLDAFD